MAGALKIALAGPRRYENKVVSDSWMGDGTAKVLVKDIQRALYLYILANIINLVWLASIAIIKSS